MATRAKRETVNRSASKVTGTTRKQEKETSPDVMFVDKGVSEILKENPLKYKKKAHRAVFEYRLVGKNGIVCFLPTEVFGIHPKTKQRSQARYATNEESVWVKEQGEFPMREPIKFREGSLFVPSDRMNLVNFLDIHPDNVKNGGTMFEIVVKEDDAKKDLEDEFTIVDAINIIKTKPIDELLPIAKHYGINIDESDKEIKLNLVKKAKAKPHDFVKQFDNPLIKLKAYIGNAVSFNVISVTNETVSWFDTQQPIMNVVTGKDPIEQFALFLSSDKGEEVLETIKSELRKIY